MTWRWEFTKRAEADFRKLNTQIKTRVVEKLDFWVGSSRLLDFAETLRDYELGSYRFRVGDYRIVFDVVEGLIVVLAVEHRWEIYK